MSTSGARPTTHAMPELVHPRRVATHTVDTALAALTRLGVEPDRIVVETTVCGWPTGTVVRQDPATGTPLTQRTRVTVVVARFGGLESLPYPLREAADEEFRVDRLMALFDNPIQKLGHYVREAGGHFALDPDDPLSARRWIEDIFHIDATAWPARRWYPLARLLPALHRIAGHEAGVRLAFRVVFDLPVLELKLIPARLSTAGAVQARLGIRNSRLAVDAVAGARLYEQQGAAISFGPVTLDVYRASIPDSERRQRDALCRLLLPVQLATPVEESWVVGDRARGARLGGGTEEAVLGVNGYLGSAMERSAV